MYLIFDSNNLSENLEAFNNWNLLPFTIQQKGEQLGDDFIAFWLQMPYKNGFRKPERWVLTNEGLIIPEVITERKTDQQTENWAIPLKHFDEAWIAFPLPDEWEQIPEQFREKALAVFGKGLIVNDLDVANWVSVAELI